MLIALAHRHPLAGLQLDARRNFELALDLRRRRRGRLRKGNARHHQRGKQSSRNGTAVQHDVLLLVTPAPRRFVHADNIAKQI